jgi:hypothetical protein
MSNWTHVAAIFRIDSWRTHDGEMNLNKIFGRELNDFDTRDVWLEADKHPERFLPCGSEGSLQMSVWTNPDPCCMAAYTVSIFGDLRDHDDVDEIISWFEEKCKTLKEDKTIPYSIRQAVITVDNERYGTQTKTYMWGDE